MTEIKQNSKGLLFLSSFSPLWIIFFGNLIIKYGLIMLTFPITNIRIFVFEWGFLTVLVIALVSTGIFLKEIKSATNSRKVTVYEREDVTGEYVLYFVAYIIPFLVNDFANEQIYTLTVMLLFFGILYVRASLVHVNPMFAIFGYRLYAITDEKLNRVHILATRPLFRDDEVNMSMIDSGFFVEVKS